MIHISTGSLNSDPNNPEPGEKHFHGLYRPIPILRNDEVAQSISLFSYLLKLLTFYIIILK